jgi:hypothetical protein
MGVEWRTSTRCSLHLRHQRKHRHADSSLRERWPEILLHSLEKQIALSRTPFLVHVVGSGYPREYFRACGSKPPRPFLLETASKRLPSQHFSDLCDARLSNCSTIPGHRLEPEVLVPRYGLSGSASALIERVGWKRGKRKRSWFG